jgi:uncharacterized alkaline shock family protein YloU
MPQPSVAGRSIVTRRAIVDIVRRAVQSSYGVTGFSDPSLGRRLLRWVGLDRPGVQATTQGGLHLDVYIKVAFGVPVAEVARQVDSAVRYSLRHLVGVEVASLTIHVDGLGFRPIALQKTEPIESDPVDEAESGHEKAAEASGKDQAHPKVPAAGETAPTRRRTR